MSRYLVLRADGGGYFAMEAITPGGVGACSQIYETHGDAEAVAVWLTERDAGYPAKQSIYQGPM